MVEFVAAGLAGAQALFGYNRKNYFFDQEMRIKREYQGQDMRIKQFELYREDVGLTIAKMDNYLIVNTLQLGFCIALYTEGRLENHGTVKYPDWMLWLYMMSISGAFLYLIMSVWLAMHASIAAHSFGVRLLTQFVRLPVPNQDQLDAARGFAQEYEGKGMKDMLRVPIWKQQASKLNDAMARETRKAKKDDDAPSTSDDGLMPPGSPGAVIPDGELNPSAMLEHVKLYRSLQANWQSYDAYSRVCMSMGTNQMLHALTYYVLAYMIIEHGAHMAGYGCTAIFTCASILLSRLDLYLHRRSTYTAATLLFIGPLLAAVGTTCKVAPDQRTNDWHRVFIPPAFLAHLLWIVFILVIARAEITDDNVALPTTFRSVLYLDVFGWYDTPKDQRNASSTEPPAHANGNNDENTTNSNSQDAEDCEEQDIFPAEDPSQFQIWQDCCDLQKDIRDILERYGRAGEHVDDSTKGQMKSLKYMFDRVQKEFSEIQKTRPPDAMECDSPPPESVVPEGPIWLKLSWNPSGYQPTYFYFDVDTKVTKWELTPGDTVSGDMDDLERSVNDFIDLVNELKRLGAEEAIAGRSNRADSDASSPRFRQRTHSGDSSEYSSQSNGGAANATSSSGNNQGGGSSGSARSRNNKKGAPNAAQETLNPAQVHRYGGAEAVPAAVLQTQTNKQYAAVTFHPTGPRMLQRNPSTLSANGEDLSASIRSLNRSSGYTAQWLRQRRGGSRLVNRSFSKSAPPGLLPWKTFATGSLVLITLWTIGLVWSVYWIDADKPHGNRLPVLPVKSSAVPFSAVFGRMSPRDERKLMLRGASATESSRSPFGGGGESFLSQSPTISSWLSSQKLFGSPSYTNTSEKEELGLLSDAEEAALAFSEPEEFRLFEPSEAPVTLKFDAPGGFFRPNGFSCFADFPPQRGGQEHSDDFSSDFCWLSEKYKLHLLRLSDLKIIKTCRVWTPLRGVVAFDGAPWAVPEAEVNEPEQAECAEVRFLDSSVTSAARAGKSTLLIFEKRRRVLRGLEAERESGNSTTNSSGEVVRLQPTFEVADSRTFEQILAVPGLQLGVEDGDSTLQSGWDLAKGRKLENSGFQVANNDIPSNGINGFTPAGRERSPLQGEFGGSSSAVLSVWGFAANELLQIAALEGNTITVSTFRFRFSPIANATEAAAVSAEDILFA